MPQQLKYFKDSIYNVFNESADAILLLDENYSVLYSNKTAKTFWGENINIDFFASLFHFDICLLDESNVLTYSPIKESVNTGGNHFFNPKYQLNTGEIIDVQVKTFNHDKGKLVIVYNLKNNEIIKLENEKNELIKLRKKSNETILRSGLLNRITTAIREVINLDDLISQSIEEISTTFGAQKGVYLSFEKTQDLFLKKFAYNLNAENIFSNELFKMEDNIHQKLLSGHYELNLKNNIFQIFMPITYEKKIYGAFLFERNQKWIKDDIDLLSALAVQISIAINQCNLICQLEQQKNELEKAFKEIKDTQAQLVQSEKMASIGQLVAGVAHEINTPLGSINSNLGMFQKCTKKLTGFDFNNSSKNEINRILKLMENMNTVNLEATRRINKIVKSLKNFARLDEAKRKKVNVHDGINDTLMLINHEIKNRIAIKKEYGDIPEIACYPDLLNQVIMNILVNSYQSIKDKGEITIKTLNEEKNLVISIKDNGIGISKENLSKIFDPGFTTKGVGVGTGLGLSICYQIIQKHKGKITVKSELNQGSEFKILLPIA